MNWSAAKLKLDKALGQDRLTAEFYKSFRDQLAPYHQELFCCCIGSGRIPAMWKEDKLKLILKEGRNKVHPRAYRPISLLNVDYKILTNTMAEQLNKIISNYVEEDQTGFVRDRFKRENIRKRMNIMNKVQEDRTRLFLHF